MTLAAGRAAAGIRGVLAALLAVGDRAAPRKVRPCPPALAANGGNGSAILKGSVLGPTR